MQIMKGGCSGIISWAIRGKDGKRISDDGPIDYPEGKILLFPIDRISSAVLREVFHEGRLINRGARNQEQEGNRDTRVRHVRAVCMT